MRKEDSVKLTEWIKTQKRKTRPIAISRVLRANSEGPIDRPTDQPTKSGF